MDLSYKKLQKETSCDIQQSFLTFLVGLIFDENKINMHVGSNKTYLGNASFGHFT